MDILTSILLGVIQGLTEFIPISSSGHLILTREVLAIQSELDLAYDAVLQLATSIAILVYFRFDILRLTKSALDYIRGRSIENTDKIMILALISGTIPAVILGLLLEDYMETSFRSAELVAWTLIAGSAIMFFAEKFAKQVGTISIKKGFIIGLFQSLALIPGMSRSGMTIAGGLFMGLTREGAARFSFLLGFPIIFGSGIKKLFDIGVTGELAVLALPLILGALSAFIVGILAIHFLLKFLKTHSLNIFIVYRVVLAMLILLFIA